MEFVNLVLGVYTASRPTTDTVNDKIFQLRMKPKKKFDYNEMSSENQIFYVKETSDTYREKIVRNILEKLLDRPFPSCKPRWLINPHTKRRLEIDCFNEDLRLAVEIDGEQHSRFLPHFHKTYDEFVKQQERDIMKNGMIQNKGIKLIRIPHYIRTNDLEKYIISQLF